MIERTLIVMAKAPRVGAGKQRLARDVGVVEAWRVNRLLQARTLRAACDRRWRTLLCVTGAGALYVNLPGVWPRGAARALQVRGDLGARLAAALAPYRNVAVIGADCPQISRARIAAAFAALRRAPFALGPSADGGFWILAARSGRHAARAMAGVRWSSEHAAADVLQNLGAGAPSPLAGEGREGGDGGGVTREGAARTPSSNSSPQGGGERVAVLETLMDIDSGADLQRWRQRSAMRLSSGS